MVRVDRRAYPVRAFVKIGLEEHGFWCTVKKRRTLETDMGNYREGTGKIIETPSRLEFKANMEVRFKGDEGYPYTISPPIDSDIDVKNTARRRNAVYITRFEIS
jgi:elongation factor P hydroxylase